MDILSHGLWGSLVAGRDSRRSFLVAFLVGVAPDILSLGLFFAAIGLGLASYPALPEGRIWASLFELPPWVRLLYSLGHSLIVLTLAASIFRLWKGRWEILFLPWLLHILLDIPFHAANDLPTPFLWPLVDIRIDGINWDRPVIFFPNILLLSTLVVFLWYSKGKGRIS